MPGGVIREVEIPVVFHVCPICGTKHSGRKQAESCKLRGETIMSVQEIFEPGKFLLVDGKVLSVFDLGPSDVFKKDAPCINQDIAIRLVSSNDVFGIQGIFNMISSEGSLSDHISPISITEAVSLGWRISFWRVWESRATAEMKEEYLSAIRMVVDDLSSDKRQQILIESVAFRGAYGGGITLE